MKVSIYDIAARAGVSVVTVSRVLNDYPSVREGNRQRVLSAMRELDYRPNAAARSLARRSTGSIGLIYPTFDDPFLSRLASSVEAALRSRGMFLLVCRAHDESELEDSVAIRLFQENRVDGILIMSPLRGDAYVLKLKRAAFPFVLLDQHGTALKAPSVTVDNFEGGYQATRALLAAGARTVAHIRGPDLYESSRERFAGYAKALAEAGIAVDARLVAQGDFTAASGVAALEGWIAGGPLPEAIFAADDHTAIGVLACAREHGIRVPAELSVIGYDDHPLASILDRGISTVRQPAEEMGRRGVELLLEVIAGRVQRSSTITLKPEVVLRDTVRAAAPVPGSDAMVARQEAPPSGTPRRS